MYYKYVSTLPCKSECLPNTAAREFTPARQPMSWRRLRRARLRHVSWCSSPWDDGGDGLRIRISHLCVNAVDGPHSRAASNPREHHSIGKRRPRIRTNQTTRQCGNSPDSISPPQSRLSGSPRISPSRCRTQEPKTKGYVRHDDRPLRGASTGTPVRPPGFPRPSTQAQAPYCSELGYSKRIEPHWCSPHAYNARRLRLPPVP